MATKKASDSSASAPKAAAKRTAAKKPKPTTSPPVVPKDTCFTIMPFGGWFDDYYDSIYQPAIDAAGLSPKRADDLYRPSTIVNDIWTYTKGAKIVLADLTGKNPNVFYELGLAHALAKPVVLVAESMNDVPFDLRALRIIEYDKNEPRWGDTLRDKVTQSIKEILAAPLGSVLPAFIETKHQPETRPITEQEKSILELRQELDLMRRELRLLEPERVAISSRIRTIESIEARDLIRKYLSMGMPQELIVRRLRDRGVPDQWAEDEIKTLSAKVRRSSTPN